MRRGKVSPNWSYTFLPTSNSFFSESSSSREIPECLPFDIIEILSSTPEISQLSPIPSREGFMFLKSVIAEPPQIIDFRIGLNFRGYSESICFNALLLLFVI